MCCGIKDIMFFYPYSGSIWMELLYAYVFDNKNIKTIRVVEYNSLYLRNKIAFKNEAVWKNQIASKPLTSSHNMVKFHFQESHESPFFLPFDFVELQDAVNRIPCEVVFLHSFLHGVVFWWVLFGSLFGQVEVEFGVEYLSVFFLRGNVVAIDMRADGDTGYAVLLLDFFRSVPFR